MRKSEEVVEKKLEKAVMAFKFHEVTKYRTVTQRGLWLDLLTVSMNWDSWNHLPPDVQEIFEELSGAYMSKFSGEAFDRADTHLRGVIGKIDEKVGNPEHYILPEDEFQRWVEAVTPVYDMWIERMEAKGLPGRAIFEDARRLAEKYSK